MEVNVKPEPGGKPSLIGYQKIKKSKFYFFKLKSFSIINVFVYVG